MRKSRMKVKQALILSIVSIILLAVTGYLYYDGTHMSQNEVKKYLEDFHDIKIKTIIEEVPTETSNRNKNETLYTLVTEDNITFLSSIKTDTKSKKQYVAASSYEQSKAEQSIDKELSKVTATLKDIGFTLYTGGEKVKVEDDPYTEKGESKAQTETVAEEVKPYQIGVTSENTVITRISLLYEKPLTLISLSEEYETLYNAVKLIRELDLKFPYLDIRGKDGEYTSGRVLLTDLDKFTSAEDVFEQVTKAINDSNEEVPSMTLTDDELKELGIDPKAQQTEPTDKK